LKETATVNGGRKKTTQGLERRGEGERRGKNGASGKKKGRRGSTSRESGKPAFSSTRSEKKRRPITGDQERTEKLLERGRSPKKNNSRKEWILFLVIGRYVKSKDGKQGSWSPHRSTEMRGGPIG